MRIAWFMATWLINLILDNLPVGEEVQIMTFCRSKICLKLKGREQPLWKSSWATFFFPRQFFFRHTWSMMSRTKLGVYSCPSLHISENQEEGKDPRQQFCPKISNPNARLLIFSFFLIENHNACVSALFINLQNKYENGGVSSRVLNPSNFAKGMALPKAGSLSSLRSWFRLYIG